MNNKRVGLKSLLLSHLLTLVCANAFVLGVMYPISTQRLADDSSMVVRGEVVELNSYWDDDKHIIFTRARVYVYETVKGDLHGRVIEVEFPGGEVGDMGMGVSDHPVLTKDEQVLLFLQSVKSYSRRLGACFNVVGAAQGKYAIDEYGIARKGGFTVVEPEENPPVFDGDKRRIKRREPSLELEDIIDNNIPVQLLVKKIRGEGIGKFKPVLSTVSSGPPGLSRPMYSSHGKWSTWNIGLKINSSGGPSFGLGGILAGMIEWNTVFSSDIGWHYSGTTTSRISARNGVNTVYFAGLSGNLLGYSNWWYSGGYIIETDVKLAPNGIPGYRWNSNRLKAVVMHELGHSLGLNHVSQNAIMKVPISDSRLRLFADDVKAVSNLYPGSTPQGDFENNIKSDILLYNHNSGKIQAWLMDGTTVSQNAELAVISLSWQIKGRGDFDGGGKQDILLFNSATGQMRIWLMDGTTITQNVALGPIDLGWQVIAINDFSGDGKSDVLMYQGNNGKLRIWLMDGTTVTQNDVLGPIDLGWVISGTDDFDGDGKADILLHNGKNGKMRIWLMDGTTIVGNELLGSIDLSWQIRTTGDFNGDGKADIFLHNGRNGKMRLWLMDGTTIIGNSELGPVDLGWQVRGIADFDGAGKDDILLHNSKTGKIRLWLMDGTTVSVNDELAIVDLGWQIRGTGDFNGDGKADIFLHHRTNGKMRIWLMDGTTISENHFLGPVDLNWIIH